MCGISPPLHNALLFYNTVQNNISTDIIPILATIDLATYNSDYCISFFFKSNIF